jgi:putative DNA primase/helicase
MQEKKQGLTLRKLLSLNFDKFSIYNENYYSSKGYEYGKKPFHTKHYQKSEIFKKTEDNLVVPVVEDINFPNEIETFYQLWQSIEKPEYTYAQIIPISKEGLQVLVLDLDISKEISILNQKDEIINYLIGILNDLGYQYQISNSRGGDGLHVWIPFNGGVKDINFTVKYFKQINKLISKKFKIDEKILEIFPSSDRCSKKIIFPTDIINNEIPNQFEVFYCSIDNITNSSLSNSNILNEFHSNFIPLLSFDYLLPYLMFYCTRIFNSIRNNFVNILIGILRKEVKLKDKEAVVIYDKFCKKYDSEDRGFVIDRIYNQPVNEVVGISALYNNHPSFPLSPELHDLFDRTVMTTSTSREGRFSLIYHEFIEKFPTLSVLDNLLLRWEEKDSEWYPVTDSDIEKYLKEIIRDIFNDDEKYYATDFINKLKTTIKARALKPIIVDSTVLDKNPEFNIVLSGIEQQKNYLQERIDLNYLFLKNGKYNIKTNSFEKYNPTDFVFSKIQTNYNPNVPNDILNEVNGYLDNLIDDFTTKEQLKDILASILFRNKYDKAQHFYYFYGHGSNGKTTLLEIVSSMLGRQLTNSMESKHLLSSQFGLSGLNGSLLSITDETPNLITNIELQRLKKLSGGGEITADVKFEKPIKFNNRATVIFSTNSIPDFEETGSALYRRCVIVYFDKKFKPQYETSIFLDKMKNDKTYQEALLKILIDRLEVITKKEHISKYNSLIRNTNEELLMERYEKFSKPVQWFVEEKYVVTDSPIDELSLSDFQYKLNLWLKKKGVSNPYINDVKKLHKHLSSLGVNVLIVGAKIQKILEKTNNDDGGNKETKKTEIKEFFLNNSISETELVGNNKKLKLKIPEHLLIKPTVSDYVIEKSKDFNYLIDNNIIDTNQVCNEIANNSTHKPYSTIVAIETSNKNETKDIHIKDYSIRDIVKTDNVSDVEKYDFNIDDIEKIDTVPLQNLEDIEFEIETTPITDKTIIEDILIEGTIIKEINVPRKINKRLKDILTTENYIDIIKENNKKSDMFQYRIYNDISDETIIDTKLITIGELTENILKDKEFINKVYKYISNRNFILNKDTFEEMKLLASKVIHVDNSETMTYVYYRRNKIDLKNPPIEFLSKVDYSIHKNTYDSFNKLYMRNHSNLEWIIKQTRSFCNFSKKPVMLDSTQKKIVEARKINTLKDFKDLMYSFILKELYIQRNCTAGDNAYKNSIYRMANELAIEYHEPLVRTKHWNLDTELERQFLSNYGLSLIERLKN